MKNKYLISGILFAIMILFGCLKTVWSGFIYFSVSSLAVLCLFWSVFFIYQYIDTYKWHFEEDFAFYKATVINSSAITDEDFEAGRKVYVKKFKKTLVRDKMIDIFKILFCLSFAITCIVAMTTGVVR